MSAGALLLRAVLWLLALYHLSVGMLSVSSLGATGRFTQALYGLSLGGRTDPAFRYAVRMLGLYALALGALLVLAALEPLAHRDVIVVVAGLQLARALCRLAWGRDLASAFGVPRGRNAINVALLVVESLVLVTALPRVT